MENCFVVGIGLMGGSFAKDVKRIFPTIKMYGIDTNPVHLETAERLNIIDAPATYADLKIADMVVLSVPVDVAMLELPKIMAAINDDTIVVDFGSTKAPVCDLMKDHPKRRNFLAGHPIAGIEFSGPEAAIFNLYKDKTFIVCEVEKTTFALQERALQLFRDLGVRLRYMNPEAHDRHIAYVSHLSHISAFMLGKTVIQKEKNERDIFDMAGSGFESTVRLAKSSPAMWTPIFKQNKTNVLETLTEYIHNLQQFKNYMEKDDFEQIYLEMEDTNYIKDILNHIKKVS